MVAVVGWPTVEGSETGLHVVAWLNDVATEREPAFVAAARVAGVGLHPVSPLYDSAAPRPSVAGFILGYAGLDSDALRRGIAVLRTVLAEQR